MTESIHDKFRESSCGYLKEPKAFLHQSGHNEQRWNAAATLIVPYQLLQYKLIFSTQ